MPPPSPRPQQMSVPEALREATRLHQRGRLAEAERFYRAILKAKPDQFDALHLLGVLRLHQGQAAEALDLIGKALKANRRSAEAWLNHGSALHRLARYSEALASYDKALVLRPASAEALTNRGMALHRLGRQAEALASFDRALSARSDYVQALNGRGLVLKSLGRDAEALESFDRALAIRPADADALNNRANALADLGRHAEALASYDRALAVRPGFVDALVCRGVALYDMGRDSEALASFEEALRLDPGHVEGRANASLTRLRLGDFANGWREYEWRWKKAGLPPGGGKHTSPLWLGDAPLAGRTILLHAEQGLGDTIQFARYVPLLHREGATVILEVQAPLLALLAGLEGVSRVVGPGEAAPATDFHCPLPSLPLACRTELATVPVGVPYLNAPADRVAKWQLPGEARLRVGLAWSGNPKYKSNRVRSIPLARLAPLLSLPVQFVSLQKDMPAADAAWMPNATNLSDLGPDHRDFADTAAVVAQLDLVIAVDTSVAHLAGAMGRPLWVLLAFSPDWRWMLARDDSPWYPTARLFRQPAPGDWDSVIARVRGELERLLAGRLDVASRAAPSSANGR